MKWIYSPDTASAEGQNNFGGKGNSLFALFKQGFPVPKPLCIATDAYDLFVDHNNLRESLLMELHRKDMKDMRWEEIWDISLRIRNLFVRGTIPRELQQEIVDATRRDFGESPLVIRSSTPQEDNAHHSFAGLHDSFVNVQDTHDLVNKIKAVWSSLWSDRAILYRQELGLEVMESTMAVIVQEFIEGDASGVLFTKNPIDPSHMTLEAVHGLNQGLVDGTIEPDQWTLYRGENRIAEHQHPKQRLSTIASSPGGGVKRIPADELSASLPPLNEEQILQIARCGNDLENFYSTPQDIEWTFSNDQLFVLQSMPVTSGEPENLTDKRSWYLSLTRSYDNLYELWHTIENILLPQMDEDYRELAGYELEKLSDRELALEIKKRGSLNSRWTSVYWDEFIPFAHGARLFGEIYNNLIQPEDPFEFVTLLTGQDMLSIQRNQLFRACAELARRDQEIMENIINGSLSAISSIEFLENITELRSTFSLDYLNLSETDEVTRLICSVIIQYIGLLGQAAEPAESGKRESLEASFIEKGQLSLPVDPQKLLELARASYRIRDDDNIHIGRIGQELERSLACARIRLKNRGTTVHPATSADDLCKMLLHQLSAEIAAEPDLKDESKKVRNKTRSRQLQGQPASRGIAKGCARVIQQPSDLAGFTRGEVLVIDSIDPTMTFFAPLAAGIIERRGGMLIHGAIIAREYGIPCITGVVDATSLIQTGELITVDGYLGICTVQRPHSSEKRVISAGSQLTVTQGV